jgi:hypothetical protein
MATAISRAESPMIVTDRSSTATLDQALATLPGVAEFFVGPYDQRGVQTKFWTPALLQTSWVDAADDGARTFSDEAKFNLGINAIDGAAITIEHAYASVPSNFLKAAALLHFGAEGARAIMSIAGQESLVGASIRVGSDVSTSDIWALCTGGPPQKGFLKTLLDRARGE